MKFRTIDIEGDGNTTVNKRLFPEGNHFDPGTIMWCVTFCDQDYNTLTLVKKLPGTRRLIKDNNYTNSYHLPSTKVPTEIDGHKVVEFTEWKKFLNEVVWQIMISDGDVYSKAYGLYNFDSQVLKANLDRNGMYSDVSRLIRGVNPTAWNPTSKQVKETTTGNQLFLEKGVRHNLEDAIELAKRINNKEIR